MFEDITTDEVMARRREYLRSLKQTKFKALWPPRTWFSSLKKQPRRTRRYWLSAWLFVLAMETSFSE